MGSSTREDQLRKRIERTLKRKVSDSVWEFLKEHDYVQDALDADYDRGYEDIVKWAEIKLDAELGRKLRLKMKRFRDATPTSKALPPHEDPVFMRALYFSKYLGRMALRDNIVVLMKERLFEGKKINRHDALRLLDSEAIRFLRHSFFVSHNIPLLDHRSYYYDPKSKEEQREYSESGSILRIEWADHFLDVAEIEELRKELELRGRDFSALGKEMKVMPNSILGEIQECSKELAAKYLWDESEAATFLITGGSPIIPQFLYRFAGDYSDDYVNLRIELKIQPWISADMVRDAYRNIQKSLYGNRRPQVSMKALQLFDFVQSRRHVNPELTWYQLQLEWNKLARSKDLRCFDDYRHFRQAYSRSRQAITNDKAVKRLKRLD